MVKKVRFLELFLIVSFVIVIFLTKITIGKSSGAGAGSNIGGGITGSYSACKGSSKACWNYEVKYHAPPSGSDHIAVPTQAIRITLVNEEGKVLPGTQSHDFFKGDGTFLGYSNEELSNDFLYTTNLNFFQNKSHKNKVVDAFNEGFSINWISSSSSFSSAGNFTILNEGAFPNYLKVTGANLKDFFTNPVNLDNVKNIYLPKLGVEYSELKNNLESDPEYFNKIALLIEPLVWFRLTMARDTNNSYTLNYAGTATEVAYMLSSPNSKETSYSGPDVYFDMIRKWKKDDSGKTVKATYRGLHFGNTALTDTIPLSIYCDTSEIKAGLQGIKHWVKGGVYEDYSGELLTSNCVGAGHVWFNEMFKEKDCEDLNYAKDNPYECCLELFEYGINMTPYLNTNGPSCCDVLKGKISPSLYNANCIIQFINCDYKLEVECPSNCLEKTEGYVKDMGVNNNLNDWQCIFNSINMMAPYDVKDHYFSWSNRYCEVFCREEISYNFPIGTMAMLAGHHFTIGEQILYSWNPIEFYGLKECRTKGDGSKMTINHEKFVIEWNEANAKVKETWDRYQEEIAYDNWIKASEADGPSEDPCDFYCGNNCSNCSQFDNSPSCYDGNRKCCVSTKIMVIPPVACGPEAVGCIPFGGAAYPICDEYNSMPSHSNVYHPVNPQPKNGVYFSSTKLEKWCPGCDEMPEADVEYYEKEYDDAVKEREQLLKYINDCNDWYEEYDTFKPETQLKYEEEMYGFNFDNINKNPLKSILTIDYKDEGYYSDQSYNSRTGYLTDIVNRWDCDDEGKNCVKTEQEYPINNNKKTESEKEYKYILKDNIYHYITKPQGFSFDHLSELPGNLQYLNIGYSNLPIHFSRLEREEGYELSLKYTTFGYNNKFNKYIFPPFNISFVDKLYDCNTIYECKYLVDNKFMYCNNNKCEDLQIIFRSISLSNPFPGEDGSGRTPGENWHFNEKLITNNRNLANPERIYFDKEPMYEINLNSGAILSIRQYNRNATGGYADFNLNCIVGEGRECKSNFIRNSDFTNLFENRCGMSSNWNLCVDND